MRHASTACRFSWTSWNTPAETPPREVSDFKKELERVSGHPNRKYFVFKSIIVNNLFGADIMEEAIEICKLRLFLKLVARIERLDQIEPLPDIDFNIRAGNSLVGYASYDDVKRAVTSKFDFENTMDRIEEKAKEIARLFTACFVKCNLTKDGIERIR